MHNLYSHESIPLMIHSENATIKKNFFNPLAVVLPHLTYKRECIKLRDQDWLILGILRVLSEAKSGRGFLQLNKFNLPNLPDFPLFFAALRSKRRLDLCREAEDLLANFLKGTLPDAFAKIPELKNFDVFAGDGHYLKSAAHDHIAFGENSKSPCGHFFALDMRFNLLRYIDGADQINRHQEHDIRALKRQRIETLQMGTEDGRKVLYIWDRASIDLHAWKEWGKSDIYFLSRAKENMVFQNLSFLQWDRNDKRNAGVLNDEMVESAGGICLRRITFRDPVNKKVYNFLTTELTLPPGILAELARRRWNIEKVFDETKNKMNEKQAWASSPQAKIMQALFICMTQQLLEAFEYLLVTKYDIRPEAELQRRQKRLAAQEQAASKNDCVFPFLRRTATKLTQHTVKLINWLRSCIHQTMPIDILLNYLKKCYAYI